MTKIVLRQNSVNQYFWNANSHFYMLTMFGILDVLFGELGVLFGVIGHGWTDGRADIRQTLF